MKTQHKYAGAWHELLFASVPVFLFVLGGFATYCGRGETPTPKDLLVFAAVCAAFLANVCAAVAERRSGRAALSDGHKRDWRPLLLVLVVALLLRLPQMGSMPRNDNAAFYLTVYNACHNFDLALGYWRDHYFIANHPCFGLFSVFGILEFFFPGNLNNMWLFQTVLSLGAFYCLYDIFERELDAKRAFWGTLLISCSPMLLGLDGVLSLDFTPAVLVFYAMWAFYRRKYVMLAWFSLLMVWCKEFGIVLLVGFFLGMFFYSFTTVFTGSFRHRVYEAVHDTRLVWLCLLCLLYGLAMSYYLLHSCWLIEDGPNNPNYFGHVGWDPGYIGLKLVEWLCMNFVWLAMLPVLWVAVRALRARISKRAGTSSIPAALRLLAAGSAGAGLLYFCFSGITITVIAPRYHLPMETLAFFWAFLAVVSLGWFGKRFFRPAATALCALLVVQAYLTVDPVMLTVFPQVETGGIPLIHTNAKEIPWFGRASWHAPKGWLGDYIVYNAQYLYLDKSLRMMLAAENYDENTDIIQVGDLRGIMYTTDEFDFYWDRENERFTFVNGENVLPIGRLVLSANSDEVQEAYDEGTLKERAIIVLPPSMDGQAALQKEFEKTLPAFYTNVERHEIRCLPAGVLPYYTADLVPPGA